MITLCKSPIGSSRSGKMCLELDGQTIEKFVRARAHNIYTNTYFIRLRRRSESLLYCNGRRPCLMSEVLQDGDEVFLWPKSATSTFQSGQFWPTRQTPAQLPE